MMAWLKKGLIYAPNGQYYWNKTHAAVPVVDMISDQVWRIYFAARDNENRSHTSFVEVEAGNPGHVLYEHPEPILPLGRLGTFDDCGIMPSWIVNNGNEKYLYYIGWTVRRTVPFHNSIGLAISKDGGRSFERFSEGPLFDSTYREPYFSGTSCVLVEGRVWKTWYLSCTKWEAINGRPEPFYHLKYAESFDGVKWRREGVVAIDFKSKDEAGIVKASVLREDVYKMWYSHRNASNYRTSKENSYRVGYAESPDGIRWTRRDELAGIDVSDEGWDSEMIEYPHVIKAGGQKYLFYNGNGFGRSGFGYATSDEALA
jgi:hypothetical protein